MHISLRDPAMVGMVSAPPITDSPSNYGNLVGWFRASDLSLNDGDAVAAWTDQSSSANNLAQSTAGNKPTYKTNIFGSRPSVRFDGAGTSGTADYMTWASNILLNAYTLLAVVKTTLTESLLFGSNSSRDCRWYISRGGSNIISHYHDNLATFFDSDALSVAATSTRLLVWRCSSAYSFKENTTAKGSSGTNVSSNGITLQYLGREQASFFSPFNGDLAEFAVYSAARSDSELAALYSGYWKPKYGLP